MHHDKNVTTTVGHLIDGKIVADTERTQPVFNPATGQSTTSVALASQATVEAAIASAEAAFPAWRNTPPLKRARVLAKLKVLLEENADKIAAMITAEHGKVLADAHGELQRGIENVEYASYAPELLKGEHSRNVGPGIDSWSEFQALGVTAGITPFNFPAMIPLWKMGPALVSGNAMILKPSERVPSTSIMLAKLAQEAGLPDGVLQVVNGDKEIVDAILDHEVIQGVGFVGSTPIAQYIYGRAATNGKRAQCFGGAKNHMIIMPDADLDKAADALIGAGFGAAGERCMAISVAVPVGEATADALIERLVPKIEKLKVGPYTAGEDVDFGPVITKASQERINRLIASGVDQGADLVVDGRDLKIQGYENGFFCGPSLFDRVTPEMEIYKEEIFGPVLSQVRTQSYDEALKLVMDNDYGNGTAIYTADGDTARDFASRVNVGMVGINFPIPVPLSYYSFGGWKKSAFGDLNQYGPDAFRFYTKTKTVTARWFSGIKDGVALNFKAMD